MKRHLFRSNKPNNVSFSFFLFNTVLLSAHQLTAHFISFILTGPQKEKNKWIHTCWTMEQLWLLIMRELSHRISVCAAVWPGGQQDGEKQLLVTDFLWTRRRGGVWEPIASGKWKSYGGGPAAVCSRTGGQMVEKEPSNTSSPLYFSDK